MITKHNREIEDLILNFSSADEKKEFIDAKLSKILSNFEELYSSIKTTFSQRDHEYADALELLIVETDKQVKGYLSELKSGFESKTSQINSLLSDLKSNADFSENELKSEIRNARNEIKSLTKDYISTIEDARNSFTEKVSGLISKSEKSFVSVENKTESLKKEIENLKDDLIAKFSSLSGSQGGGSMNRQILVGGVNPLTRYTDYNIIAGAGITITTTNDDANRRVNLTIVSSGSSSFETPVGTVNDSNLTFTVSNTPKYIIVNGAQYLVGTGLYASYSAPTITLSSPVGTGGFIRSAY